MIHESLRQALIELPIIDHTPTRLRSGEISDYYCDVRRVFARPKLLKAAAETMRSLLPAGTTCVAASGYGGLPLGTAVSISSNLPLIGVRSESKSHGKSGRMCGYAPTATDRAVIIDDVLTSGSSLRETVEGLMDSGVAVIGAVVLVRRNVIEFTFPVWAVFEVEGLLG